MLLEYEPGQRVADVLDDCLDEWMEVLRTYHDEILSDEAVARSADPPQYAKLQRLLRLYREGAPELFRTLLTLRVSPEVRELARELSAELRPGEYSSGHRWHLLNLSEPVTDWLDIELAAEALTVVRAVTGLTSRSKRVYLTLLAASCEGELSDEAARYLARAGRLLLFGFDVECVVMCRAVLEAALTDRLDFTELDRLGVRRSIKLGGGKPDQFSLADLIYGARRLHLFDPEEVTHAHGIREAGNSILHDTPDADDQACRFLMRMGRLLRKLYPYAGPGPGLTS